MSAQPAYRYESAERARHSRQDDLSKRRLRVVFGQNREATTVSPSFVFMVKIVAVALVTVALLSFVRIALNTATVASAMSSQTIASSVDKARSEASSLELRQSALASTDKIKARAAELGMVASPATQVLVLTPDPLTTDASGALSLSGSIANLVKTG